LEVTPGHHTILQTTPFSIERNAQLLEKHFVLPCLHSQTLVTFKPSIVIRQFLRPLSQIANRKSKIGNFFAGVAELVDAPRLRRGKQDTGTLGTSSALSSNHKSRIDNQK
jgi:hypothetical protein